MTKFTKSDLTAIVAKGGIGLVPIVGPLAAEIIGTVIPNQRIDRIEETLHFIQERLDKTARNRFEKIAANPESLDIFEGTLRQAASSVSEKRRTALANVLVNGLKDDQRTYHAKKKVLDTLERLNESEIILLYSRAHDHHDAPAFWEKNKALLFPPLKTLNGKLSKEDEEASSMHEAYLWNLVNLGLCRLTDYDSSSILRPSLGSVKITAFGRLLLEYIATPSNEPED